MGDPEREKRCGFSHWYLKDVLPRRWAIRSTCLTPGFGLVAQLFAVMCRFIILKADSGSDQPGQASL